MTQNEIIEMAKEAGLEVDGVYFSDAMYRAVLVRFAKLVATKEREACAKLCEQEQEYWGWDKVIDAAKLIRARGEKQESVAWEQLHEHMAGPFYQKPPQRTWVGLTEEEIFETHKQVDSMQYLTCAQAIEAKLKEKNNA